MGTIFNMRQVTSELDLKMSEHWFIVSTCMKVLSALSSLFSMAQSAKVENVNEN